MINWRVEENRYINTKLEEFERPALYYMFTSEKKQHKDMQEFVNNAKLEYRENKLNSILLEVKKEREKINDLVNEINSKFEDYMYKQNNIISKYTKPFKVKISNDTISPIEQLEVVSIQCEPFKVSFIQEKID